MSAFGVRRDKVALSRGGTLFGLEQNRPDFVEREPIISAVIWFERFS
jgi:hypothetical protein